MNFRLIVILIGLLSGSITYGQDRGHYTQIFEEANEAYKQKDYEKALSLYRQVVEGGVVSHVLYYNMGNSFYKSGRLPEAVLYYERGLKLKPNDQDLQFNLEIAQGSLVDKIEPIPQMFWKTWWDSFVRIMSLNGWTILFFIFLCTGVILTGLLILGRDARSRKLAFLFMLFFYALSALSITAMLTLSKDTFESDKAIVFSPSLNVKSEPGIGSTEIFVVHEGTKVSIVETEGEWVQILLSDGKTGWVEKNAVEII